MNEEKAKTEYLYIVLVATPGIFATLIRLYTRHKYIHVVLSMDEELLEAYSFGRRNPKIPIISGFEQERMDKVIEHFPRALCMVTRIKCTQEQKNEVRKRMEYYKANAKRYHYAVLGLPFLALKKKFHQKRRYVCSQFVARTLEDCGIREFDKHYSLMTPKDFYDMQDKEILYVGTIEGYLDKMDGYAKYVK